MNEQFPWASILTSFAAVIVGVTGWRKLLVDRDSGKAEREAKQSTNELQERKNFDHAQSEFQDRLLVLFNNSSESMQSFLAIIQMLTKENAYLRKRLLEHDGMVTQERESILIETLEELGTRVPTSEPTETERKGETHGMDHKDNQ